jgi:prophage maintenance system killer protein
LFGGGSGIRDRGALESAVAVPQASFDGAFLHEDLFAMAAAYGFCAKAAELCVAADKGLAYARSLQLNA